MGEVYRATDTKLGCEVAIEMLPVQVSGDPERLARLQREAKVLASLNHPSIAGIHSFEHGEPGAAPLHGGISPGLNPRPSAYGHLPHAADQRPQRGTRCGWVRLDHTLLWTY